MHPYTHPYATNQLSRNSSLDQMEGMTKWLKQGMDILEHKSRAFLDENSRHYVDIMETTGDRVEEYMQITLNKAMFQTAQRMQDGTVRVRMD